MDNCHRNISVLLGIQINQQIFWSMLFKQACIFPSQSVMGKIKFLEGRKISTYCE